MDIRKLFQNTPDHVQEVISCDENTLTLRVQVITYPTATVVYHHFLDCFKVRLMVTVDDVIYYNGVLAESDLNLYKDFYENMSNLKRTDKMAQCDIRRKNASKMGDALFK